MKFIYDSEKSQFLSEDNVEMIFTNIKYVNLAIKSKDTENEVESEVLGIWTYDLMAGADIYYTIINGQVTEFVAYKVYGKSKYIINMNNQIIECIPENGDAIFDDYKECKLLTYLNSKIEGAVSYED